MGDLYFVRHGQTVWNVENKICGQTDSPLTEKGHAQAVEAGNIIKDRGIQVDKILCSPLSRAHDTAIHIGQIIGGPVEVEPRLVEQNFGKYEGTPRDGEEFKEAKTDFIDSYEGGETMLKLAHRIYGLLDDITSDPDTTVLLVAHNGISRVVQSYFYDMTNDEYAAFGIPNCDIRRFTY